MDNFTADEEAPSQLCNTALTVSSYVPSSFKGEARSGTSADAGGATAGHLRTSNDGPEEPIKTLEDEMKAMRAARKAATLPTLMDSMAESDSEAEVELLPSSNGPTVGAPSAHNGNVEAVVEEPFNQRTDLIGRSEQTPSSASAQAIGQRATLPGECLEEDTGVEAKEIVNDTALLDQMGLGGGPHEGVMSS